MSDVSIAVWNCKREIAAAVNLALQKLREETGMVPSDVAMHMGAAIETGQATRVCALEVRLGFKF